MPPSRFAIARPTLPAVLTERRAALVVATMATLWGSVGVVVRQVELPAVALVAGRVWVAAPVLTVFVRSTGRAAGWSWRPSGRLLLNGAILAAHWVCFVAALQRAPIGTVLLITYLAPVGIAALAPAFLGEVVPARTKVALAVAVAGIALIAAPAMDGSSASGVVLALLTGALYVPLALLNKALAAEVGGVQLARYQVVIAAVLLAPVAAVVDWGTPTIDWLWLLVLGAVYTALAFGAFLAALEHLPATRAVVLLYLEPVAAVVFGWLLLGEDPTAGMLVGGMMVVGAGLLVARTPVAPELPPVVVEPADHGAGEEPTDVPG